MLAQSNAVSHAEQAGFSPGNISEHSLSVSSFQCSCCEPASACAPLGSPPRPEQPPAAPASPPGAAYSGPASQPAPGAPCFWFVGPSWSRACQSSKESRRDNDRMRNRADRPRPHESDGFQVNEILITCHRRLLFLYIYDNLGGGSFFFIEVGVD